jgi:MSHA biogenesis protein MshL
MKPRHLACGLVAVTLFVGCAQMRPTAPVAKGHLDEVPSTASAAPEQIPDVVYQAPFVPPPTAVAEPERYTVVVNDVPVRELLFALARDAELNIDVAGEITGKVTLNAIDQTLPQILERIARQVDLRYEITGDLINIEQDDPYFRTYDVGYVNLSRDVDTTVNVATRVATTGQTNVESSSGGSGGSSGGGSGGDNNASSTRLNSHSYNRFWETLTSNILAILGEPASGGANANTASDKVVVNAEAGMISIRATAKQHQMIEQFIDKVLVSARRQVMIEATIVEVTLNDQYQGGVDWSLLLQQTGTGVAVNQSLLGQVADGVIDNAVSSFSLGYFDPDVGDNVVSATVRLLHEYGDTRVLSSPRLMVLNNQTAVLKVVEELVYFTVEVTDRDATATQQGSLAVETEIHSVPVGLVMAVTPQVSESNEVTLTVRPSISQKIGDAIDPGPQLAVQLRGGDSDNITNAVPIIRVREMESVLKLVDGQIGVLGGLMQDAVRSGNREVPGLSKLPLLGDIFFNTDEINNDKTELVVFLRPVVVHEPNIDTDLESYRKFLHSGASASPTGAP